jgi:hypothetical protein
MGAGSVLDPEPGGRLRVGYPTGQVAGGRVVAVEPDRRIVFSWGYEGDGQAVPAGSSTVEITLEPEAGGTRVRLRHSGLPAGEPPAAHLAGWRHALATLSHAGAADQLALVLDGRVAAWNEPDPVERAALPGADLDGRFRWVTGFWDPPPDRPEPSERH